MFDLIIKPSGWEVTDDQGHVCPHTFPYCAIIPDETERGWRGLQVDSKESLFYKRGVYPNDYCITWGRGLSEPPKDYVTYVRPLMITMSV